jgi:hypothetical protein
VCNATTLVTSSVTTVALDPICVIPIHKTNSQQQPPPTHKHKFLNAYQTMEDTRSKPWQQKQQQQESKTLISQSTNPQVP